MIQRNNPLGYFMVCVVILQATTNAYAAVSKDGRVSSQTSSPRTSSHEDSSENQTENSSPALLMILQALQSVCNQPMHHSDKLTKKLCSPNLRTSKSSSEISNTSHEDEQICKRLPSRPAIGINYTTPINLLDLLNHGSDLIDISPLAKDVILILGNTGSGKTTLTQILAGDLDHVHAVMTQSDRMIIVDDDNRIGLPSTVSKTLVPELVIRPGNPDINIYDCPGFDDTRGLNEDIAVNYFINRVIQNVNRIKIIFTVIHSSVKPGNDRLDFDLFAEHASAFAKNIPAYKNGIGLVVTKTQSYSARRRFIKDDMLLHEIVDFITVYNQTLYSKLASEMSQHKKERIQRKIDFAKILLEQDENGNYSRITFSRDPEKCGMLSKSKEVAKTRNRVTSLYELLEYVPVNYKEFGYTLKGSSRIDIFNTSMNINTVIAKGVQTVCNDFRSWFDEIILKNSAISKNLNTVEQCGAELDRLKDELKNVGNTTTVENLHSLMKNSFKTIGYKLPQRFSQFMERQRKYLQFFDEATGSQVFRNINSWMRPVYSLVEEFSNRRELYSFCSALQKVVFAYPYQSVKKSLTLENGLEVDWLNFINSNNILYVSDRMRGLKSTFREIDTKVLDKTMRLAVPPAAISCNEGVLTVKGNFVRFSEFLDELGQRGFRYKCGRKMTRLEVYASDSVFVDIDLKAQGTELNVEIVAPNWYIIGERQINLDGLNAPDIIPRFAQSGDRPGASGTDGLAGKPGGAGGSFFGLASHIHNARQLTITVNGGSGGRGQDGGNGTSGSSGRNAFTSDTERETWFSILIYTTSWRKHGGYTGRPGGDGGDGGVGGLPGKPGQIYLASFLDSSQLSVNIHRKEGSRGISGNGGLGGIGGESGKGLKCTHHYVLFFKMPWSSCEGAHAWYSQAVSGSPGGVSETGGVETPKLGAYSIVEWRAILKFRLHFYNTLHNTTVAFINALDENESPMLHDYYSTTAFSEELLSLKGLPSDSQNLVQLYLSVIHRLEVYTERKFRTLSVQERKGALVFLAYAYSSVVDLKQSSGFGMVTDVGHYFKVVQQHIDQLKVTSTAVEIEETRANINSELQRKIEDIKAFISSAVLPSMKQAEMDVRYRMASLEKQFEELLFNAQMTVENVRGKLSKESEMEVTLNLRQVLVGMQFVTKMLELLGAPELAQGLSVLTTLGMAGVEMSETQNTSRTQVVNNPLPIIQNLVTGITNLLQLTQNETRTTNAMLINDLEETEYDLPMATAENQNVQSFDDRVLYSVHDNDSSLTPRDAITYFGEGIAHGLFRKFQEKQETIQNLEQLLTQAKLLVEETESRRIILQQQFVPLVEPILNYLRNVRDRILSNSSIPLTERHIEKWQVRQRMTMVKTNLQILADGINSQKFISAIDRLQDALTMIIDLYDNIDQYKDAQRLTDFVALVNSASYRSFEISDPILHSAVVRLELAISTNSLDREYKKAIHAFKQWVFPFAKVHLEAFPSLSNTPFTSFNSSLSFYTNQLEKLNTQLDRYKAMTLNVQDTHIIYTDFSSSFKSSRPFYTWKNEYWGSDIADLLAGKRVHFKADIRNCVVGQNAIKFRQVEINFKVTNLEMARELEEDLEFFGVSMTHSGVSYYRYKNEFFVMTGSNQTISYNFERDSTNGNRLARNRIYNKFQNGDYLLSPYTLWTFQLEKVFPTNKTSFRRLERYAPYIDLELVGNGIYVDDNVVGDLQLDKYYERDISIRENLEF